uniref:DNA-repair protein Xrcc1 N-terminal domain-containing protein n=1 Tax=Castor canadensis TaxID=51338 RepID=A0A8C0WY62_CASCN
MPEIRLRHVVSCSSQDSTHCAENLLKADTYRKWRAAKAGEKTISVVLQLEKEEQIHSVDIGNDGSAFVEVLVGSSAGGTSEQDYEVSRTGLGVVCLYCLVCLFIGRLSFCHRS